MRFLTKSAFLKNPNAGVDKASVDESTSLENMTWSTMSYFFSKERSMSSLRSYFFSHILNFNWLYHLCKKKVLTKLLRLAAIINGLEGFTCRYQRNGGFQFGQGPPQFSFNKWWAHMLFSCWSDPLKISRINKNVTMHWKFWAAFRISDKNCPYEEC